MKRCTLLLVALLAVLPACDSGDSGKSEKKPTAVTDSDVIETNDDQGSAQTDKEKETDNDEDLDKDPCDPNPCKEENRGECKVEEDKAVCLCDSGFHLEGDKCVSDTKKANCKDKAPENGESEVIETDITWDGEKWSEPGDCEWDCKDGFHSEDDETCIANTKKEDCKKVAPANATDTVEKVDVTWDEAKKEWNAPTDCAWECDNTFHKDANNECVSNTKKEDCKKVAPANATDTVVQVDVAWDETNKEWNEPADCAWSCNDTFHTEDNATCIANSKKVDCKKVAPANATDTVVKVDVTWDGIKWTDPAECAWSCNDTFHTEDAATCVADNKQVDCADKAPTNADADIKKVEITWNKSEKKWNDPAECDWNCKADFHTEDNVTCISNTKQIACADKAPENATAIPGNVDVTWNETEKKWNIPADCAWNCDATFHTEDSATCISDTKQVDCLPNNVPANASATVAKVDVTWDGTKWSDPAVCAWTCDSTFHTEDNATCVSNTKQVACTQDGEIANGVWVDADVEITWDTFSKKWTDPALCAINCDSGFYKKGTECRETLVIFNEIRQLTRTADEKAIELLVVKGPIDLRGWGMRTKKAAYGYGSSGTLVFNDVPELAAVPAGTVIVIRNTTDENFVEDGDYSDGKMEFRKSPSYGTPSKFTTDSTFNIDTDGRIYILFSGDINNDDYAVDGVNCAYTSSTKDYGLEIPLFGKRNVYFSNGSDYNNDDLENWTEYLLTDDGVLGGINPNQVKPNSVPVANPGSYINVNVGDTLQLDGSGSSDLDQDDTLTYNWALTSKPAASTATIENPTTVNPTIEPDVEGDYVISLTVNDGKCDSEIVQVTITARPTGTNRAPIANAGNEVTGKPGDAIALDGSASTDGDNDSLTYSWTVNVKPEGAVVTFSDPATATPTATVDKGGVYELQLVVNDGTEDSAPATVKLTASEECVADSCNGHGTCSIVDFKISCACENAEGDFCETCAEGYTENSEGKCVLAGNTCAMVKETITQSGQYEGSTKIMENSYQGNYSKDIFYKLVLDKKYFVNIEVKTDSSDYYRLTDSYLYLDRECGNTETRIDSNDNIDWDNKLSKIGVELEAGEYYIVVEGKYSYSTNKLTEGNFTLDVQFVENPCEPVNPCTDPNRTSCSDANGDGIAECGCDAGFHLEEDTCLPNTKTVSCDDSSTPENATASVIDVESTWNETDGAWNAIPVCEWSCDTGFTKVGDVCEAETVCNTPSNPCTDANKTVCTVTADSYSCGCDNGYEDDGSGTCIPSSYFANTIEETVAVKAITESGIFEGDTSVDGLENNYVKSTNGKGKDVVYKVILEEQKNVTITLSGPKDILLWYGPDAESLYKIDAKSAGKGETTSLSNYGPGTFYIVVDGWGENDNGPYTLNVEIN